MTTLTYRAPGPDKKAAEMSDSDEAGHANRAHVPVAKADGTHAPAGPPSFADRRRQHAWVPRILALLTALIGLSDILGIFKPDLAHRLHKITYLVPGTLTNVTRTADVVIGLMLLLLAHGLRRRKRRAWQAVAALLAFDIAIHFFHSQRILTASVAIVVLIGLLYFRDEFYAEGDQRTRWRALWVFGGLIVADVVIGLSYILLARGLVEDYSLGQRVEEVITGLVGVSGPVQWVPEARGDLFGILTSALGIFTLVVTVYLFLRPAEPRARLGGADAPGQGTAGQARGQGLARLLRAARRQERDLVADRQGLHLLPGRVGGDAGQRRPDRRPGGLARRDRSFPGRGGPARLGAGRDGVQRARRGGVVP